MVSKVKLRAPVTENDHAQGSPNAPLVLLEYGDYECPYCAIADSVIKRLQQTLRQDLRYVFRNFPLMQFHPHALDAAEAAEAAGLQGKFWEMYDMLYGNQDDLDSDNLLIYAQDIELDTEQFLSDSESKDVEERIAADIAGGISSGVMGTPTFYINGYRYDEEWSYHPMLATLQSLLKSGPRQQQAR